VSNPEQTVIASGAFDTIDAALFRFMQMASEVGRVKVLLWTDSLVNSLTGSKPKFNLAERAYVMNALRYVNEVTAIDALGSSDELPAGNDDSIIWAVPDSQDTEHKRNYCARHGIDYRVIGEPDIAGFPEMEASPTMPEGKSIVVTGCYDWFHSGHVRFFEEVSEYGNLNVVVGHDANVRMLKGEGHPMFSQDLRRYMAQSIRYVTQAYVSTGHGWMDAEPEIERIKPDIYAVNADGDRPEKRKFCEEHGLEYLVLTREPKPGLTKRSSTDLRGF